MSVAKIFKNLHLTGREAVVNFEEHLETTLCKYAFSVVWTSELNCNLNYLAGNRPPSTAWQPIITAPVSDNDGEITYTIGYFAPGTEINLSYGIQAVEAIPRLDVIITNLTERKVVKYPEGDKHETLLRGEFIQRVIPFKLP